MGGLWSRVDRLRCSWRPLPVLGAHSPEDSQRLAGDGRVVGVIERVGHDPRLLGTRQIITVETKLSSVSAPSAA